MIAMAGMFLGGSRIWTAFAIGTILVVAIAVIGSLTVLPAMLAWLGDRVEKGRVPIIGRRKRSGGDSRAWGFGDRPRDAPAAGRGGGARPPCCW